MGRPKKFERGIALVYRASVVDAMLYGYVTGVLDSDPALPVGEAVQQFVRRMGLEEEMDAQHASNIYYRYMGYMRRNSGGL